MLETLNIRNIAVIDTAEIPFKKGLNILSGETGAGKSIVIEAISLILGSRASADLVRAGCDEAVVEGLFDVSDLPWVNERLARLGLPECEGAQLLIKRVVSRAGKHRVYVNGGLATLSTLQELCEGLVDLCGQHEHQSLVKPATQLELLDRYGSLSEQTRKFGSEFSKHQQLAEEKSTLEQAEAERGKRSDFLKFQIDELTAAQLREGEDDQLQQEKSLLQSAEARVQAADSVRSALEADDGGLLDGLRSALAKLRTLSQLDARAETIRDGMERALAEAEEASLALHRYLSGADLDPERLTAVQERLAQIADLRRKYGASVGEMLATLSSLEKEAASLGQVEERIAEVSAELEKIEALLTERAKKLSAARTKAASLLAKTVTDELKDLRMVDAQFSVELTRVENGFTATGIDQIQFCVQPNRGEVGRPLGKIASGGELSRLMLAIRRVIADRGGIGVYLFDEIDAGIGGQTAFQVGKKLRSVAKYNQVICITHLPQVASFADHHLSVRKTSSGKRTVTEVIEIDGKERKAELARMLGGPELTKKSLENAAELMDLAGR